MTQSKNDPKKGQGGNAKNDDRKDPTGRSATRGQSGEQSQGQTGKQGTQASERGTKGAPDRDSQGMQGGEDCSTQGGARSKRSAQGSQSSEGSDQRRFGNDGANPTSRQNEDNRSRQGQSSTRNASQSVGDPDSTRRDRSNRGVSASPPTSDRPERENPRVPREFDTPGHEPKRSDPGRPSRISDPIVGRTDSDGESEPS